MTPVTAQSTVITLFYRSLNKKKGMTFVSNHCILLKLVKQWTKTFSSEQNNGRKLFQIFSAK